MLKLHKRVSPSGKARASQARIRGFESRHPLQRFCGGLMAAAFLAPPKHAANAEPLVAHSIAGIQTQLLNRWRHSYGIQRDMGLWDSRHEFP